MILKTSELSVLLVSYGFGRWKMIETYIVSVLGPYRRVIAGEVVIILWRCHLIFSKGGVNKNPFSCFDFFENMKREHVG